MRGDDRRPPDDSEDDSAGEGGPDQDAAGEADPADDSAGEPDYPVTVAEFLTENYRLFTVISVFAALSVYLSDLGTGDPGAARLGVGAALVLFLVASVTGVVRAYRATVRALGHPGLASTLWVFPHALFMYALLFLSISIVLIIESRYPGEVGSVLASGVMYTLIFVYWSVVTTGASYDWLPFLTGVGAVAPRTPYVSLLPTAAWGYLRWDLQGPAVPPGTSLPLVVGYVARFVLLHLVFTGALVAGLLAVDRLVRRRRAGRDGNSGDG